VRNHADTQLVKRLSGKRAMRHIYTVLNLDCRKCARTKFHCANCLVELRNCAVAHLRGNTGCCHASWLLLVN